MFKKERIYGNTKKGRILVSYKKRKNFEEMSAGLSEFEFWPRTEEHAGRFENGMTENKNNKIAKNSKNKRNIEKTGE